MLICCSFLYNRSIRQLMEDQKGGLTMKKFLVVATMFLFGLFLMVGCVPIVDSWDDPPNTDTDSDTDTDSETPPYTWHEGDVYLVSNQAQYDWVIQRTNVIVAFVDTDGDEANLLLNLAAEVMGEQIPWIWLAKVEMSDAPEVFENAGVETAPTLKFFSYGVEMTEMDLIDEASAEQVAVNAQILIDRYQADVIKAETASELETMLSDPTNPILVKFGATWCGPCNFMIPRLELASIEYGDDLLDENGDLVREEKLITIIDVDVDEVPSMGATYGFSAIPFFVFYNDGVRYGDMLGSRYYETLASDIDAFLNSLSD